MDFSAWQKDNGRVKFFSIFRDWAEYICIARFTILAGSNNAASIFVAQLAGYWIRLLTGIKRIAQVHDQMMKPGMVPHTRDEKLNAYIEGRTAAIPIWLGGLLTARWQAQNRVIPSWEIVAWSPAGCC